MSKKSEKLYSSRHCKLTNKMKNGFQLQNDVCISHPIKYHEQMR